MALKGRSIWRIGRPKRWVPPEKKETPHIILPNGLDSRCAMGKHDWTRKEWLGDFQLVTGKWVKRYQPFCSRCRLHHEKTFEIDINVN